MTLEELLRQGKSFGQGASNAAASTVTGPVDMLAWLLRKGGVPVGDTPIGGEAWMRQKGLMATPENKLAGLLGEGAGLAAPIVAAAKAPEIAGGLLQMGRNLAAPQTMNKQAGIVSVGKAKTLNTKLKLPDDELFSQAVANTPGAQIGDDGLKMLIQRNQTPDQAMATSVRGGVFYLPEGAAQAKHYSTGKNGYGGTEKIIGETLLQNPLFVKGATGGKAPQAAIDQIMGKGTYDAIRNDALKTIGYGTNYGEKVNKVRSFLDKYAPELADEAETIVMNSNKGNQLPYALQEAAVGSAVRNAGHDGVLGYSKGKQGPFLSELFDVRESRYPNKFGDSEVWDKFFTGNGGKP